MSVVIYLLAFIALVTIAVLCWKAFGPQLRAPSGGRVIGPDDDPEFLWQVSRRHRSDGSSASSDSDD